MKKALFIFFLLQSIFAVGQNVGGNYCDFKYVKSFSFTPVGGTWQVPAGVTKIMIECWGGGGGGASGGGGGGGGYAQQTFVVTPLNFLTIFVGDGGVGASTIGGSGSSGTSTSVDGDGVIIYANQGYGAGSNYTGPGGGGNVRAESNLQIPGNNGSSTTETYVQRSATEFATVRKYGDGAKSVLFNGNEGRGAAFTFNTTTLANISLISSNPGSTAGAGGGGGPNGGGGWGSTGARGLIIIHY